MEIRLRVPGKTFLLGEYLVLFGDPALVMTTAPYFELQVSIPGTGGCRHIHPHSPAGLWVRQEAGLFKEADLSFHDPHKGRGGLGCSGAQFVLTYYAAQLLKSAAEDWPQVLSVEGLWQCYRELTRTAEGISPSGADVVAQAQGALNLFSHNPFRAERLPWPFRDKAQFIVRTGKKVLTHEHLRELSSLRPEGLRLAMQQALQALRANDWPAWLTAVGHYYEELVQLGLVCLPSQALVEKIKNWAEVQAVKSCGALGADTILIFGEGRHRARIEERIRECGLEVVADSFETTKGFQFEVQWESQGTKEERGEFEVEVER